MKGSMRAAMALGIGYALGRKKRLRTATLMAAATAFGSSDVGSMVLKRGLTLLSNTDVFGKLAPQLGDITDSVRGDLLDAGKAAFSAAVSNQVDTLTSSIHDRAERLRNPGEAVAEGAGQATEAAGTAGRAASSGGRRAASTAGGVASKATGRGRGRDEDDRDEDELDDYEADDHEADDYEADDYEQAEEDTGEPDGDGARGRRPAPAGRGSGQRRSPVSRARR